MTPGGRHQAAPFKTLERINQKEHSMATYSLDLDFIKPPDDFPDRPRAQIYIKYYSTEKDRHFITPQCVSFQEFDYEITRLEDELKALRKKARKKFADQ
jgi:hypothetical protein